MPANFDLAVLRSIAHQGMFGWSQNEIDMALAFIYSRGWKPAKTTASKGPIVPEPNQQQRYTMTYEQRQAMNNITDARFSEAGTPGSCGAQKALKRAIKLTRGHSRLKDMIAEAEVTLARHVSKCNRPNEPETVQLKELLTNIRIAAGG